MVWCRVTRQRRSDLCTFTGINAQAMCIHASRAFKSNERCVCHVCGCVRLTWCSVRCTRAVRVVLRCACELCMRVHHVRREAARMSTLSGELIVTHADINQ